MNEATAAETAPKNGYNPNAYSHPSEHSSPTFPPKPTEDLRKPKAAAHDREVDTLRGSDELDAREAEQIPQSTQEVTNTNNE